MNGRSHLMYPQNRASYHMILPGGSLITELWLLERTPTGCEAQEFLQKTMCVSLCECLEIMFYICLSDNSKLELSFEALTIWLFNTCDIRLRSPMLAKQRPLVKGHWRIPQGVYRCWLAVARDMAGDGNILVNYMRCVYCVCVFW